MKIDKTRTASFDVDAQRGFTPLCPDELPVQDADKIVPELNAHAAFACLRVGSKDAHSANALWVARSKEDVLKGVVGHAPDPDGKLFGDMDVQWPLHCVPGTEGFELLDGLPFPQEYDFFVWKGVEPHMHPYGACFHGLTTKQSTGVIEYLQAKNIQTVLVGGIALDYCVATTALQLRTEGNFDVVVNLAATRGVATKSSDKALQDFKAAGIQIIGNTKELELLPYATERQKKILDKNRTPFFAFAELLVASDPKRIKIVHNEADDTTTPQPDAAHFLKLDGKRLGRDLELYAFMQEITGETSLAATLLEEIILPLKKQIPASFAAALDFASGRKPPFDISPENRKAWEELVRGLEEVDEKK